MLKLLAILLAGALSAAPAFAAGCPVQLGHGASLGGARPLPRDNAWNRDISTAPVDHRSSAIISRIGRNDPLHADFGSGLWQGARIGIPYVVVSEHQPRVPIRFTQWPAESDPGPYPVPADALVEAKGRKGIPSDGHVLVVQRDPSRPNCLGRLFELFDARRSGSAWTAANGAVFDLNSNALRPAGWTSADAAGLPIFPGLVRFDEVAAGEIRHALRVTVPETRKAYIHPARHWASGSTDPSLPPMGTRLRLRQDFNVAKFPPRVRVILTALKRYGMLVADNGPAWFITGAPDQRWNNSELAALGRLRGRDLEVVKMGPVVTP